MSLAENPSFLNAVHILLGFSGVTALGASVLHLFWAAGGRFARSQLIPKREGHQVYRADGLSNMAVAAMLLFGGLIFLYGSGLHLLDLTPWVAKITLWFLFAALLLRLVGDFQYVGFFHRGLDANYRRWENRLFLPLLSVWFVASILSLYLQVGTPLPRELSLPTAQTHEGSFR